MDSIRLLIRKREHDDRWAIRHILEARPEMQIVGEVTEHIELLVAVRDTAADAVLMIIHNDEDEGMLSHLFTEYPDLTVLAISSNSAAITLQKNRVFIERRCRYRSIVNDITPSGIANAICQAVHEPCDLINPSERHH